MFAVSVEHKNKADVNAKQTVEGKKITAACVGVGAA